MHDKGLTWPAEVLMEEISLTFSTGTGVPVGFDILRITILKIVP